VPTADACSPAAQLYLPMRLVAVSHGTWSRVGRHVGDRPHGVGAANSTPLTDASGVWVVPTGRGCGELLGGGVVAHELVVFGRPSPKRQWPEFVTTWLSGHWRAVREHRKLGMAEEIARSRRITPPIVSTAWASHWLGRARSKGWQYMANHPTAHGRSIQ
jgi:hypothetical protein